MLGSLSPTNTIPMLGLLLCVKEPKTAKLVAYNVEPNKIITFMFTPSPVNSGTLHPYKR